jgi:hypothetical protein
VIVIKPIIGGSFQRIELTLMDSLE